MQDMVTIINDKRKRKTFYHGDVMVVSYAAKDGRFEMVGLKKDNQTRFTLMWNTEKEAEEYFTYVKEDYIRSVLGLQNKPTLAKKV